MGNSYSYLKMKKNILMEERIEGQKQHLPVVRLQPAGQVVLVKGRRTEEEGMAVIAGAQQKKTAKQSQLR